MTTSHLPRRAVIGVVLAASIVGGGLVAAFADDVPAAGACPTWTDPKGDATTAQLPAGQLSDDQMDIVGVSLTNDSAKVVAAIKVTKLGDTASDFGDEYHVNFTLGGKSMQIYSDRGAGTSFPVAAKSPVGFDAGFYNITDNTSGAATSVYDLKTNTVTITGTIAELSKALGSDATGKVATALVAESQDYLSNPVQSSGFLYDDAATKLTFAVGADCGGAAAAPAPADSASPSPSPSSSAAPAPAGAAPAAAGAPTPDCFTAKDPKGDAYYPEGHVTDADLDILGVTLGTTADALVGYFKVDKLAAGPSTLDGHRFTLNFTFNKHAFAAAGSAFKDAQVGQIREGAASTGRFGHLNQLSVDGSGIPPTSAGAAQTVATGSSYVASGLKYTFDTKTSTVSLSLPLADIAKYGQAPIAGATLTGVYVSAATDTGLLASTWDTAPDGATAASPGKLTYPVGDNACFGAAATAPSTSPLTNVGAVKAQYGDAAAVAAKLVDASGAPVAGKDVTFALGASSVTAATGADGVAKAALPVKNKAGKSSLVISSGDAKTAVDFTVLVEKTALKATGSKGTVTATLTDDDKKPVAGQVVTFTSGAKKVSAKTDAKGVATAKGLPAGTVKVSYPGAGGMYSAASTSAKA